VLFAKRFFDAYDLHSNNHIPTQSWDITFKAAAERKLLIMHHLLLGINAHINLDLGIVAVETMSGKPLGAIKKDYDKINDILAEMVEGMATNISSVSLMFGLVRLLANKKEEMLLSFSIRVAREGAWEFAQRYHRSTDRDATLHLRDDKIALLARKLSEPGWRMRRIIDIVRLGEFYSVQKVMERLDEIADETTKL